MYSDLCISVPLGTSSIQDMMLMEVREKKVWMIQLTGKTTWIILHLNSWFKVMWDEQVSSYFAIRYCDPVNERDCTY